MGHKCKCQSIQSGRKNHPFNLLCNGLLTFSDHLLSSAMLRLVPAFSTGALTSGVCQNACLVFVWHGLAKSQSLILKSWIFTMVKSVRSLFFPIVHHILHFFACSGPILFIPPPMFFPVAPGKLDWPRRPRATKPRSEPLGSSRTWSAMKFLKNWVIFWGLPSGKLT